MRDTPKIQNTGLHSEARTRLTTVHVNQPRNVTYIKPYVLEILRNIYIYIHIIFKKNNIHQQLEATHAVRAKSSEQGGSGPNFSQVVSWSQHETGNPTTNGRTPILFTLVLCGPLRKYRSCIINGTITPFTHTDCWQGEIEPIFSHCHVAADDYEQKMPRQICFRHWITSATICAKGDKLLRSSKKALKKKQIEADLEGEDAVRYWCHNVSPPFSVFSVRDALPIPRVSIWQFGTGTDLCDVNFWEVRWVWQGIQQSKVHQISFWLNPQLLLQGHCFIKRAQWKTH